MESKSENREEKEDIVSSVPERISHWRNLYLIGCCCFPLVFFAIQLFAGDRNAFSDSLVTVLLVPFVIIFLPFGLIYDVSLAFDNIGYWLGFDLPAIRAGDAILWLLGLPTAYAIFFVHRRLTMQASTYGVFMRLMLVLILLICGSLVGCVKEFCQPIGMQY